MRNCELGFYRPGAALSKVPRKILGKLLILLLLLLLLLLHSFLLLCWTELIGLLVQCSTVSLYPLDDVATCVSVAPKIRSFPKIFLGTFKNACNFPDNSVVRHMNEVTLRWIRVSTGMGDRLQVSIPPRHITKPTRSTQCWIPSGSLNWVPALISWGKGRKVCWVTGKNVWFHMAWVHIVVRHVANAVHGYFTLLLHLAILYWTNPPHQILWGHRVITAAAKRRQWLGEEMYGVWSGGYQAKR